jgi:hypothetical protein
MTGVCGRQSLTTARFGGRSVGLSLEDTLQSKAGRMQLWQKQIGCAAKRSVDISAITTTDWRTRHDRTSAIDGGSVVRVDLDLVERDLTRSGGCTVQAGNCRRRQCAQQKYKDYWSKRKRRCDTLAGVSEAESTSRAAQNTPK